MKNLLSITILFFAINLSLNAQYFELGVFFGGSNYSGDLVPTIKPVESDFHMALGLLARYNINERFSVKGHYYKGRISGSDLASGYKTGRLKRNLSFGSDIQEIGFQGEFNFLRHDPFQDVFSFTPYAFLGVAGFHFSPEAIYDNQRYELQPIGTEGQGLPGYADPYKLYQVAIPAGLGLKFSINGMTTIGFEVGMRKTFTDYLDDVSGEYPNLAELSEARGEIASSLSFRRQEVNKTENLDDQVGLKRGNPNKKDWYMFGGITISIALSEKGYY